MAKVGFYTNYAWRNIRRGGLWTALAIFSVAAGVATVVALRSLGLAIGDSLISNIAIDNKGDIRLTKGSFGDGFGASFGEESAAFTDAQIAAVRQWAAERNATVSVYVTGRGGQVARVDDEGQADTAFGRPQFVTGYYIEPGQYPSNYTITAIEPEGVPIGELFTPELDVVISQNLAEQQNIAVGDRVRIGGTEAEFIVRGIVDTAEEAGISNLFAAFFGFTYLDIADARATIGDEIQPNTIAITFPDPITPEQAEAYEEALVLLTRDDERTQARTSYELLEGYQNISQVIADFIVVMGLGALLIGGVGIMNTMLVMVRRRTTEIAAVKTFGLKARQVAALFLAEGLLLGLLGSILGSVIGILLGGLVNQYGETFLQQRLVWRIYPEALVYGFVLGMVITVIFGLAPILTALRVRPGIILRPNETHIPRLGALQTIGLLLLVTVLIGLIVGQIIRPSVLLPAERSASIVISPLTPYIIGVIGVAFTLLFLGFLVMVLWVLVWLIGKLPSFGSVSLRLALRNLSTGRLRTATVLLALSAGMFALSSITFVGQGTRELLNLSLVNQLGGNVLAFPVSPGPLTAIGNLAINNALRDVPGVVARNSFNPYNADLVAVDGVPVPDPLNDSDFNRRFNEDTAADDDGFDGPPDANFFDPAVQAYFQWDNFVVWQSNNPEVYQGLINVVAGRNLTPEDAGQPVLVGPVEGRLLGIEVGSIITYRVGSRNYDIEVVGLSGSGQNNVFGSGVIVAPGVIDAQPSFQVYTFRIEDEGVNEALVNLSAIRVPPTFSLDVSFIDSFISRIIDQFAAIPTVVGLLSLAAAAVIMANAVALSTLERRRQIGILKAVGLKAGRVLRVMLIETVLVALLSAIIGIGLSSVFVTLFTGLSGTPIPLPADARLTAVALIVVAVLIGVVATFLSANVAVRERVMNVLRYE